MGDRTHVLITILVMSLCVISVMTLNCGDFANNMSCSTNATMNESTTEGKAGETGIPPDDEIGRITVAEWNRNRRSYLTIRRYPDRSRLIRHLNGTYFRTIIRKPSEIKEELLKRNLTEGIVCLASGCVRASLDDLNKLGTMQLREKDLVAFAIALTFDLLMMIIGISGNLLLILGVNLSKKLRNSTGVLLSGLAATDILVLGICLPVETITWFFEESFQGGEVACHGWIFVKYFCMLVSTGGMTAMALDRYIAVCIPLQAKTYCTVSRARYIVAFIWVLCGVLSVPVAWFADYVEKNDADIHEVSCNLRLPNELYLYVFRGYLLFWVFVVPLCVMLPAYLKIFFVLWKSTKSATELQNAKNETRDDEPKSEAVKSRIQVIRMLLVVLASFVICWGPYVVLQIIPQTFPSYERIKFALISVAYGNSFVNPLIYFTMSSSFRGFMLHVFRTLCGCRVTPRDVTTNASFGKTTKISEVSSSIPS